MQATGITGVRTGKAQALDAQWLVLFHQIPPTPAYLRVKVGRRLSRIGAVGLKNTVYVLPRSDAALEDLQWVIREITEGGGEATLCEARFIEGLSDDEMRQRFRDARDEDYGDVADAARKIAQELPRTFGVDEGQQARLESDVARLEQRLEEIAAIDYFHAAGREGAVGLVAALRDLTSQSQEREPEEGSRMTRSELSGRVWVTRTGVHVDRIASAWLVRRFIDGDARFKFVPAKGYKPERGEVRFDMFDAEFTHEGERCTFEVLVARLSIREPGVSAIAEIVHDIDLKESKFNRAETAGVAAAILGLCSMHREDEARLAAGFALFDYLKVHFSKKRS